MTLSNLYLQEVCILFYQIDSNYGNKQLNHILCLIFFNLWRLLRLLVYYFLFYRLSKILTNIQIDCRKIPCRTRYYPDCEDLETTFQIRILLLQKREVNPTGVAKPHRSVSGINFTRACHNLWHLIAGVCPQWRPLFIIINSTTQNAQGAQTIPPTRQYCKGKPLCSGVAEV